VLQSSMPGLIVPSAKFKLSNCIAFKMVGSKPRAGPPIEPSIGDDLGITWYCCCLIKSRAEGGVRNSSPADHGENGDVFRNIGDSVWKSV